MADSFLEPGGLESALISTPLTEYDLSFDLSPQAIRLDLKPTVPGEATRVFQLENRRQQITNNCELLSQLQVQVRTLTIQGLWSGVSDMDFDHVREAKKSYYNYYSVTSEPIFMEFYCHVTHLDPLGSRSTGTPQRTSAMDTLRLTLAILLLAKGQVLDDCEVPGTSFIQRSLSISVLPALSEHLPEAVFRDGTGRAATGNMMASAM